VGNEWGEAYLVLHESQDEGKSLAEKWEEQRIEHWKQMRAAWLRWDELVKEHEAYGYNRRNPYADLS
jgi:hypothetical protein